MFFFFVALEKLALVAQLLYTFLMSKHFLTLCFCLSVLACSNQHERQVQGYIEGKYTYIATSVSGTLEVLNVAKGQMVKTGQALFTLERQPEADEYAASLENYNESLSARDAIAANLSYAKITYERYKVLVAKQAIQQALLDNATSNYLSIQAQLAQANATIAASSAKLAEAKWTNEQKIGLAPVDAMVFDTYYRLGEYIPARQPILSLLAGANVKVIFYVKASVLPQLQLGKKISVQTLNQKNYPAHISFISPSAEYTPPVIYSDQTNNQLVFRIEAEFGPDFNLNLHPGEPVTVVLP
jgi:HlyD family secretion protein